MSLGSTQPFRPAGTVTISAGSSSTRASLAGAGEAVLVTNTASGTAFIRFGTDNSVVASAADMPVPAGARLLLHAGNFASTVAVVLNSGSGSVYVTRGDGTVY
jgi:hypothetical protein